MKKISKINKIVLLLVFISNLIFPRIVNASNAVTEAYNDLPESQLGLANILSIILISIGVVLILLGIAIFIKLKDLK